MTRPVATSALFSFAALCATALATGDAPAPPSPAEFARAADVMLRRNYRSDAPGAAVLVARGDTVLYRAARGEADVDGDVPLRPESVFRLGSVTKQFAAAAVLTLVEAGKVALEDPLAKYVPDYPDGDRITVLQLLNHTSGVMSYTRLPGYMDGPVRRDLTTAELIDTFANQPPDFAPGTTWTYSNSGYVLAGAVIEAASGMPWHAYLEQVLFEPLGMEHTGYGHDPAFAAQQVNGYSYAGDQVVPMRTLSMTQPHAAGALVSNVDDLLEWNRALHEGRVLESDTYARMITPVGKASEAGVAYGLGLFKDTVRDHEALYHGGGIFGFTTVLRYVPGPDVTVAVLENDDARNGREDAATLARRLAALALGEPYPEMRAVAVDAAELREAEGVYRFDAETTRILRMVDGNLTAQRGLGPRVVLTPIAIDDFLYEDGFNRLKIERAAGGEIAALRFFANGDGAGVVGVRTDEPLATAVAMQLPRAALERLAGTYEHAGLTMQVFLEGAALKAKLGGQDHVTLLATSTVKFDVAETGASLEFPSGDAPAAQVTMRQGGREMTLPRVR